MARLGITTAPCYPLNVCIAYLVSVWCAHSRFVPKLVGQFSKRLLWCCSKELTAQSCLLFRAKDNIQVNCVLPGAVDTDFVSPLLVSLWILPWKSKSRKEEGERAAAWWRVIHSMLWHCNWAPIHFCIRRFGQNVGCCTMWSLVVFGQGEKGQRDRMVERIPAGRLATADDIVGMLEGCHQVCGKPWILLEGVHIDLFKFLCICFIPYQMEHFWGELHQHFICWSWTETSPVGCNVEYFDMGQWRQVVSFFIRTVLNVYLVVHTTCSFPYFHIRSQK